MNPDFSVGEVAKELGRRWNDLTEEQKAPFEKSSLEDRQRYEKEMKAYKALNGQAANGNGHHVDENEAEVIEDE